MDHILSKYCPRIDFDSYEDFKENFTINAPETFNFAYDVVDEWARVEPDKKALVWTDETDDEKTFTFTDISRLSNQAANALTALGIGKGDVVMMIARRRWEYWIIATALCKMGAVVIPATLQLTTKDITYRAQSAQAKAIVCVNDPYVIEQAEGAFDQCPTLVDKIMVAGEKEGWTNFNKLIEGQSTQWTRPEGDQAVTADDLMLMYFTSGTTGNPKMVMHNFAHPLGHILTARYWQQVQENTLHMSVSDSGWAKFGWGKIYGQWICGATIFAYDMVGRFNPLKLLKRVQDHGVTTFCCPPTMYRFMLEEDLTNVDLSCVTNFTTAGEPLNPEVVRRWQDFTGKQIREGFGQTETCVLIATWPWVTPQLGSTGKPAPVFNIKLYDENGIEVEDGEEGAICVPNLKTDYPVGLFRGYAHNPKRSEEAVGGEYYNLHDLCWRDSQDYLYFIGRNDDVIKCSGYRIGPFEVESAIIEHPAVVECAVTAAPDPVRGKVVKATCVLAKGYEPSEALVHEIQQWVKDKTAPYKYPRIVVFVDELPKTVGGKIKRALIRKESGLED